MPTIADLMPEYREYLAHERRMAANTMRVYLLDLKHLNAHLYKDVNAIQLTDLREYQRKLAKEGRSNSTMQRIFAGFMTFWRWMRMEGYVTEVLTERIQLPRKDQYIPRWLDAEELRKLLTTPVDQLTPDLALRDSTAWRFLAWTGVRQSELAAMKVSGVRFSLGLLVVWAPKVRKERVLPLPDALRSALMVLCKNKQPDDYLFDNQGRKWSRSAMTMAFHRHLRTCGLDRSGITMHSLRHTYATMLVQGGASVYEVKELLGHADIKSTMKYVHADATLMARRLAATFLDGIDRAGNTTDEVI